VLTGLYLAWQNVTARVKALVQANKDGEPAQETEVTDRFTKAKEQLRASDNKGNPQFNQRSRGIYALERIGRDFEEDHWPVMEVLTAYVREHAQLERFESPEANPITVDIKAALTVIRRRKWHYEERDQTLDLHGTDLHDANLEGAYLRGADLEDAYLRRVNLRSADLKDANFKGADLRAAVLESAYLRRTTLEGACLRGVDLVNADLRGVDLWGADLKGAYLRGADLRGALGITQEQINSAIGDATTKLPAGLVVPESWKKFSD
jgi:hypothetical protein